MTEFFHTMALILQFPWPAFFIGAFAFAMLAKLTWWLLFNRKRVNT